MPSSTDAPTRWRETSSVIPLDDPTSLSMLFHLNSEPWLNDEAYRSGASDFPEAAAVDVLDEIALPEGPATALDEAIAKRRSCRLYAAEPLSLDHLASVLRAAYGTVPGPDRFRRAVPSAGGLYPLDVYAFVRRVTGLEDGLYHYDALTHTLSLTAPGDHFAALEPAFYAYPFIVEADVVLALSATFARAQSKYGPRGYRYVLLEAGHVAQNVCLQAAELGLASLCMGGYVDSQLNELLALDQRRAGVVYALGLGHAAEQAGVTSQPPEAGPQGG